MLRPLLLLVAISSGLLVPEARAQEHLWSKHLGDTNSDLGFAVAVDGSGNAIVTGYFGGTVDFGGGALTSAGNDDIFVAKFDTNGNHLWSKRFGNTDLDRGIGVAVDGSGNVFVTGEFEGTVDFGGGDLISAGNGDVFVAKFDSNGNHLWSKRFGDTDFDVGNGVAVDGSGNVFVTGEFATTVDFGGGALTSAGSSDIFVAKFDSNGNHLWSKRFGDTGFDIGNGVAVDGSGNAIVAGLFQGSVDFGGVPLTSAGSADIFVAKFDSNGNHLWSKRFGDTDNDRGNGVAVDGSGNAIVTGDFQGSVDFGGGALTSAGFRDIFVAKFDSNGNHLWSKRFGDTGSDRGNGVALDGSGNVFVTGEFEGTVDFGGGALTSAGSDDIFVAKFDSNGNHLWSKHFGDTDSDRGNGVAVDGSGNAIITGEFRDTVDFGGGVLTSAGGTDIFIAKFSDNVITPVPLDDCVAGCVTVDIDIDRSNMVPVRAFSVRFSLSTELELCSDLSSIDEGSYLTSGGGLTNCQKLDLGGATYQMDCSVIGTPCPGAIDFTGTLFSVRVKNSGIPGTGTLTVTQVILRDCSNADLPVSAGPPTPIPIDMVPPIPIADLTATQVRSGNDTDGTTQIEISYTMPPDATDFEVYRLGFGDYPEYDDGSGSVPPIPTYPPVGWTLVPGATSTGVTDEPPTRDFWYYAVFTRDLCGNVSLASRTDGTLNYHLGDVHDGITDCSGENMVDFMDISYLDTRYGDTLVPSDPDNCLDVGPTTDASVHGRPTTDNLVDFEELVLFSFNESSVSKQPIVSRPATTGQDALWLQVPDYVEQDLVFEVPVELRGSGKLRALSVLLSWDPERLEALDVESGGLFEEQNGILLSPGPGAADAALRGRPDVGVTGEGVFAIMTFRARSAGVPEIEFAKVDGRSLENERVDVQRNRSIVPVLPTVTGFLPGTQNPFQNDASLAFSLATAGQVEFSVFSVNGRRVKTLARGPYRPGIYSLIWDGTDNRGARVPSGVYYTHLDTPSGRFTRKLVYLR